MEHATRVRLEAKFWRVLEELSAAQNMPMLKFLSLLYEEAQEFHGEVSNIASLLQCCCVSLLDPDFDRSQWTEKAKETEEVVAAACW